MFDDIAHRTHPVKKHLPEGLVLTFLIDHGVGEIMIPPLPSSNMSGTPPLPSDPPLGGCGGWGEGFGGPWGGRRCRSHGLSHFLYQAP